MEHTLSVDTSLQSTIDRLVESRLQSLREELARELFSQMAATQAALSQETEAESSALALAYRQTVSGDTLQELNQWTSQLIEPTNQTDVMAAFVQASAHYSGRCGLFVRRGDIFALWRSERFPQESAGNLRSLAMPSSQPGVFKDLLESQTPILRTRSAESIPVILQMALGNSSDDFLYLFPILVQGKLVAALYADSGSEAGSVDPSALEILSRVAGLSLETCAARAAWTKGKSTQTSVVAAKEEPRKELVRNQQPEIQQTQRTEQSPVSAVQVPVQETEPTNEPVGISNLMEQYLRSPEQVRQEDPASPPASLALPVSEQTTIPVPVVAMPESLASAIAKWTEPTLEAQSVESDQPLGRQEQPVVRTSDTQPSSANGPHLAPLPNLDSMSDEDRDAHRKAHRFARVAVQDLLSYHKNKIDQGREERNLYALLKDDIDKTRENYRLRFGKTSARKFDYLHHELVVKLAANNPELLGDQYPGPEENQ